MSTAVSSAVASGSEMLLPLQSFLPLGECLTAIENPRHNVPKYPSPPRNPQACPFRPTKRLIRTVVSEVESWTILGWLIRIHPSQLDTENLVVGGGFVAFCKNVESAPSKLFMQRGFPEEIENEVDETRNSGNSRSPSRGQDRDDSTRSGENNHEHQYTVHLVIKALHVLMVGRIHYCPELKVFERSHGRGGKGSTGIIWLSSHLVPGDGRSSQIVRDGGSFDGSDAGGVGSDGLGSGGFGFGLSGRLFALSHSRSPFGVNLCAPAQHGVGVGRSVLPDRHLSSHALRAPATIRCNLPIDSPTAA